MVKYNLIFCVVVLSFGFVVDQASALDYFCSKNDCFRECSSPQVQIQTQCDDLCSEECNDESQKMQKVCALLIVFAAIVVFGGGSIVFGLKDFDAEDKIQIVDPNDFDLHKGF